MTPAPEQVEALVDAMDQLLDDMGKHSRSVCLHAKAKARVAFEPWAAERGADTFMSLADANAIVESCET